jgi:hypothetical protein
MLPSYIESLGLIVLEAIFLKKYIIISENVPFDLNGTSLGETLKLDEILWFDRISHYLNKDVHFINNINREIFLNKYDFQTISKLWEITLKKIKF